MDPHFRSIISSALEAPDHRHIEAGGPRLSEPINTMTEWWQVEDIKHDSRRRWNPSRAIGALGVHQVVFAPWKSSIQAHASGRTFAISPTAASPLRALMHELAHIELGHTYVDTQQGTTEAEREVQAEVTAFALLALIGAVEGTLLCTTRSYIAGWSRQMDAPLTGTQEQQIEDAAMTIWRAGRS